METSNINQIIKTAYGRRYNLESSFGMIQGIRYHLESLKSAIQSRKSLISTFVVITAIIGASIYYYNLLITTEQDVLARNGKIHALMQRRNDISINLAKAVFDYSNHERNVFTAIVALRTMLTQKDINEKDVQKILKEFDKSNIVNTEAKALQQYGDEKQINFDAFSSLSKLFAVAEQYPDLKLSTTFQSLMTALIEVEKDLANERIKFNDAVNIYTTNRAKFPVNIYAQIFGFKDRSYYEATDNAKTFKPIFY